MSRPIFRPALVVSLEAGLLLLLLAVSGCSSNKKSQLTGASVSGVVRYKGKPVTGGVVQLWCQNHDNDAVQTAQGTIQGDGTYQVLNAPLGVCKVVVNTKAVKHDIGAMMKKFAEKGAPTPEETGPPKVYMEIDPKYTNREKTDVQITIQNGHQTQDIDLP
jgi:hypothetical protein